MKSVILKSIFKNYAESKVKILRIASHIDVIIEATLDSEYGENLDNTDGFSDNLANRQIATIRTLSPDEHKENSGIVIEIFAEGRVSVTAFRRQDGDEELRHSEERTLYFSPQEEATSVAARTLSVIVDINENDVAEAFNKFVHNATKEINRYPNPSK